MQSDSLKFGFTTLKRWLENRNENKYFPEYIKNHGWNSVAIYGAGEIGQILYHEIKDEITILYFIDRNAETYKEIDGISVILPQDISKQMSCDIIINTVMSDFDNITDMILKERPMQAVIALRDAVYEF